ncbi:MAG: lipid II flippase MurJ, partial [Eubacteriales bacterium]|nr:lipid II flippase MurJ [Eubacteriales bacterium]
ALILSMQKDVIQAIFQWTSSYTPDQISTAASVLRWYALAMIAQTFVFITNQAFYARKMTRIALVNGLITLFLNPLLCLILLRGFKLDISGLSLAYTLTSAVSAVFLYQLYKHLQPDGVPKHLWSYNLRLMAAASAATVLIMALNQIGLSPSNKILQLLWLGARSFLAIIVYLAIATIFAIPEAHQLMAAIQKQLRKMPGLSKFVE